MKTAKTSKKSYTRQIDVVRLSRTHEDKYR